jgi:3',5'-cyclic-AMP phosphodiesterase
VRELTTVADDFAVVFDGATEHRYDDLTPDTDYDFDGVTFRTLPRPGELLCRFATVNDVHFGETVCGVMEGFPSEGALRAAEGDDPYPDVMNRGAIAGISAVEPVAVLVKGDLTADGTEEQYAQFLKAYEPAFGDVLHHIRGNHEAYLGQTFAPDQRFTVDVPGARLAVIDTTIPRSETGTIGDEQLAWLDDLAGATDRLLVFGHHHVNDVDAPRKARWFGLDYDDSNRLVDLVARRPSIKGYFAGHTHRNRVRRFARTGATPFAEIACVKDFPGSWAEYRVFDGGFLQIHHRINTPDALAWSERCRSLFGGVYPDYAMGSLDERCFRFG